VEQVLWTVDGEPFALAEHPYTVRWPLLPGEHRIQAELPYSQVRSQPVRVRVE
jgi:penicillin-binding protein 1C